MHRAALVFACVVAAVVPASAEVAGAYRVPPLAEIVPGIRPDPAIPSPDAFFGVPLASRALRAEEIVRYFEALAARSARTRWIPYARSHEGRPLGILAISDEATVARLETFQEEHRRRLDPRLRPEKDDKRDLAQAKAVAWMAYSIHGDELSSADAAVALAYALTASDDERMVTLRSELVILIDPCENPDGRERFLAQTTAFAHRRASPDNEDLSHTTVWPWGRGNHYLFDLNRDWISQVHPESRRAQVVASWSPQLLVDSHEMGPDDTYLFSPSRHPFNPYLPSAHRTWAERYAADQAHRLDERGFAYYTGEWNEEFFPGYGSSWASYLGAVGILYEMASTEGTWVRQRAGTVRTYPQAVEHQLTSSLANLETLARSRAQALGHTLESRREGMKRGREGAFRAFVLPRGRYPDRTDQLATLLEGQGIEVLRLGSARRAEGLHDTRTGEVETVDLAAGSYLVPLEQPAERLARVLLDPHVPMEAEFLREEREYIERGRGSRLYDTTAWSLPLLFGVEAYWSASRPAGDWLSEAPPGRPEGAVKGEGRYGFVFEGTSDRSAFALADLLQQGVAVRVAEKPFRVGGLSFDTGAVLAKREGNPDGLRDRLGEIARRHAVEIHGVDTSKAEDGPDLGGHYFHPLVAPRVGIFASHGISPSAYGALWHLFDEQVDLRFTALDLARFQGTDLSRYNVLVFPPVWGSPETYRSALGKDGLDRLRRWIEGGGTAIGIGSGTEFLASKSLELTKARLRSQALDRYAPVVYGISAQEAEAGGPFRAAGIEARTPLAGGKPEEPSRPTRSSPYDVAPVIGPGAKPFLAGRSTGTPISPPAIGLAEWLKPLLPPGQEKATADDLTRGDERLRRFSPRGTILRVTLDPKLWLNWGLPAELPVWWNADDALVAEPPVQSPVRFADVDRLHLGGLLWPEAAGRLARTAYTTREGIGRGQVLLFLEEPTFRGWTLGTRRLLLNAVLYGPGLGTSWSAPW